MNFRTKIPIPPQQPKIDHRSKILLLGSCFVENIGGKMDYYKFQTLQNPFGILFHPAAIAEFLGIATSLDMRDKAAKPIFTKENLFYHNERWHCFDAHSSLSSPNQAEILQQLNAGVRDTHIFLQKASHVIVTLGTAWGYRELKSNKIVANCHKLPQKNFKKELTNVKKDLLSCVESIKSINPKTAIIFTVSPVRHLKDGFVENQQSKAQLISAIHEIIQYTNISPSGARGPDLLYFPSYELMMDELRDYRFYSEDMVHPNGTAINYIWKRFQETWIAPKTLPVMKEIETIQKGLAHRSFNENSISYREFRKKLQLKIERLKSSYPEMEF